MQEYQCWDLIAPRLQNILSMPTLSLTAQTARRLVTIAKREEEHIFKEASNNC
jgi:hypothetical protein